MAQNDSENDATEIADNAIAQSTAQTETIEIRDASPALVEEFRELCDVESRENDGAYNFAGENEHGGQWRVRVYADDSAHGCTFEEWLEAAGRTDSARKYDLRAAWRAGEDPSEYAR